MVYHVYHPDESVIRIKIEHRQSAKNRVHRLIDLKFMNLNVDSKGKNI